MKNGGKTLAGSAKLNEKKAGQNLKIFVSGWYFVKYPKNFWPVLYD